MITLNVSDFCHNCPEFEAEVNSDILRLRNCFDEPQITVLTVVTCAHEQRCKNMLSYLKTKDEPKELVVTPSTNIREGE